MVYRKAAITHVKLTGYLSLVVILIYGLSCLILTAQAAIGTRISYSWALILRRHRMGDQTRQILASSQQR